MKSIQLGIGGIEDLLMNMVLKKNSKKIQKTPLYSSLLGNQVNIFQFGITIEKDDLCQLKLFYLI